MRSSIVPKLVTLLLLMSSLHSIAQENLNSLVKNSTDIIVSETGELSEEFKTKLKRELSEVRILSLGEASHLDGLTFEHKSKLIKFLHEEMGFNVLAFEYSFCGEWLTNQNLKTQTEINSNSINYWFKSKYAYPLYEYIKETHKTDHSLNIAGFDEEKLPDGSINIKETIFKIRKTENFRLFIQRVY